MTMKWLTIGVFPTRAVTSAAMPAGLAGAAPLAEAGAAVAAGGSI